LRIAGIELVNMQILKKIITFILMIESRLILAKYKPFIIAVTGSVGKTSTKDAIYVALKNSSKYVRKSEKSMNSEIGLPLTIIGAPNAWHSLLGWLQNIGKGLGLILRRTSYPDTLILEMGADHPGDIRNLAKWLKPNIAVITKVSQTPVHVEFFKSKEEVFEEKASLATSVRSGGVVVLFADDENVMSIAERLGNIDVLSFGLNEKATVRGLEGNVIYESPSHPAGFEFGVNVDGETHNAKIKNAIGSVYMYPILASVAVAKAKGILASVALQSLSLYEAPKGRMNLISGINDSTIIDDTYNSSPDAAISALATLKGLETTGKKIAVLGDMMELGKYASEEHRKVGRELVGIVDELVTVGTRSKLTADEALKNGFPADRVRSFARSNEVAECLVPKITAGDIVLVKGSQSVRMERVVASLLKEPQKADRLLVRQEKEWLAKK